MKKLILSIFFLAAFVVGVQAQQDHQYTQFMYNKLLLNPAYAGARSVPFVTGIYRNQWFSFDGAPKSALLSYNSPFLSKRVGVGATISHQQAGLQRDFFGSVAYSYDVLAQEDMTLRVGVQGSLRSLSMDFANAQVAGDAGGVSNDPSLVDQRVNDFYGNVGAGVYATFAQRAYVGFSVPRIYSNTIGYNTNPQFTTAKEYRHYYGMAGIILPINKDVKFLPALLVKYVVDAPFDADINLNLDIKNKVTFGLSYRLGGDGIGESMDILAYWQATDMIGIGAAYDFTLSNIRDYTAGSFEVLLQADLKKDPKSKSRRNRKNLSNPRFFL